MTLPALLFAIRWLVRDTFRQARASGVTGATLAAIAVCTLLCLSVGVSGDPPEIPGQPWEDPQILPASEAAKYSETDRQGVFVPSGEITFLFGAFHVKLERSRSEAVRFVEMLLTGSAADTAGVLLALVWTAGFLPTFFDPATATVLFAKPLPRWLVLIGKFAGVLLFVAGLALLFVTAVWATLGVRTNVWDGQVFAAVPLLLIQFGCFYAVSALIAVTTRSAAASVVGTMAAWLGCWAVNYAHQAVVAGGATAGPMLEAAYWILPKPVDQGLLLIDALGARAYFGGASALRAGTCHGGLVPEFVLISSCVLPVVALAIAGWRLNRKEY